MDDVSRDQVFSQSLAATAAATARVPTNQDSGTQMDPDQQRAEKVQRLRNQVAAGAYEANAGELAKRLVDEHLRK